MTTADRETMLRAIDQDLRETCQHTGIDALSQRTRDALRRVPRDAFVLARDGAKAYENVPLSIGHGQTISQPFIVALMTELLRLPARAAVLEIGTGCGYQTAVLAEIAAAVHSIEIVEPLARSAAERLHRLGYRQVHVRIGDGATGWPEAGPFDGIIVTAAARTVPEPLIAQLRVGGRLVAPIGPPGGAQTLVRLIKRPDGSCDRKSILPVAFVPLTCDPDRKDPAR